jgi:TolB-like protein
MVSRHHGWCTQFAVLSALCTIAASVPAFAGKPSAPNTLGDPASDAAEATAVGRADAASTAAARSAADFTALGRMDSVEIQFRRLGDQLAEGIKSRAGGGRYDRWAVLPFTELGPDVERNQLGLLSTTRLESVLSTDHQFINIDRNQLMEVVREKGLMHVLVFEEGKIRQVGRAVGADVLVSGSVGVQSGRYVVNARAANVETGQVVATARAEIERATFNKAAADNVMRTRYIALLKSAVVPGWGQWSNHDRIKSGVIFAGTITLLTFAIRNVVKGYTIEQRYLGITSQTPGPCPAPTTTDTMTQFQTCLHQQAGFATAYFQTANKFFAGLGALYLLNLADAFIFAKNPDSARSLSPSLDVGERRFGVDFGLQGLTLSGSF